MAVVFFGGAAEEFEQDHEEDGPDAGAGKDGGRGYVPALGNEAGVYCVPVPEHL